MSKLFVLEKFESDSAAPLPLPHDPNPENQEEVRLAAYEQGYKAGWDDCTSANEADQTRISDELASNLNELSFTYHEVKSSMLRSLEPVLTSITDQILPHVARENMGALVLEHAMSLMNEAIDIPVEITAAGPTLEKIKLLADGQDGLPISYVEETTLGEGQAFLRLGSKELQLDLDAILQNFSGSLSGFFELNNEAAVNG